MSDTLYREGEWVGAGNSVVRMLPPTNAKVRFFVPQSAVGAPKPGQAARLHYDNYTVDINATVTYIATETEYTSPVIYSNTTRNRLVFIVETRPVAADGPKLRSGQPVEVTLS